MRDVNGRLMWSTKNEMDFIKAIGTGQFSTSARVMSKTQIELLEGYVAGAKQRSYWGSIDKEACIGLAEAKIESLKLLNSSKKKVVKR